MGKTTNRGATIRRSLVRCFSLTAVSVLSDMVALGCRLTSEGENLVVEGSLDDDLRRRIRENKRGLVELVKAGEHRWRPTQKWHAQVEETRLGDGHFTRWLVFYSLDRPGDFNAFNLGRKK